MDEENITPNDIKSVFSNVKLTSKNGVTALTLIIKRIMHGYKISINDKYLIYLSMLRGFSINDNYFKNVIYSCIPYFLGNNSFMGISLFCKELESDNSGTVLRSIFRVIPEEMICDMEKHLIRSVGNKFRLPSVLVILQFLLKDNKNQDMILRWIKNIDFQKNTDFMQYLVFRFYAELYRNEIHALKKNISKTHGIGVRGFLFLISKIMHKEKNYVFKELKELFKNKEDLIGLLELCKFIASLSEQDAFPFLEMTLSALRNLLRNKREIVIFSALNVINRISMKFSKIESINREVENLVSHKNKSISLLAIEILLRIGNEKTIDRLTDKIPQAIHTYSDTFKMTFLDTLEKLSTNYSTKRQEFVEFLKISLNNPGTLKFKAHVVRTCDSALNNSFNEDILQLLSTYIEDSQYPEITMLILKILGTHIPKSKNPNKYLIHILNRLILEDYKIQSSALLSLHSIASQNILKKNIKKIFQKSLKDENLHIKNLSEFLLKKINVPVKRIKKFTKNIKKINFNLFSGDLEINVLKVVDDENVEFLFEVENLLSMEVKDVELKLEEVLCNDSIKEGERCMNRDSNEECIKEDEKCMNNNGNEECIKEENDNSIVLKIDELKPFEKKSLKLELKFKELIFNPILKYSILDENEIETEIKELETFGISILDKIYLKEIQHELIFKENLKFKSKKNILEIQENLIKIFNLKIQNQIFNENEIKIEFIGSNDSFSVKINILLKKNIKNVTIFVNIESNDENVIKKICNLLMS